MRVFVAGASGAVGAPLVTQLVRQGHEVTGTHRSAAGAGRIQALGARSVRLDLLDGGPSARRCWRLRARPSSTRPPPWPGRVLPQARPHVRADQPAAHGGHRKSAGRRSRGRRRPLRGPELCLLPLCPRGRRVKTESDPLDPAPAAGAQETNAAMRTWTSTSLLRAESRCATAASTARQRRACRAGPQAAVPGHRQRPGRLLVHPSRRCRGRDRARAAGGRPGHLQHRR